ncbi:MAG: DUF3108 domain-containing protein [Rhodoferax sp.]|nr:DUF3108 domain-containing protein [Rhodoferax sp.]
MRKLLLLTAVVALLHGALLGALPHSVRFVAGAQQPANTALLRGSLLLRSPRVEPKRVLAPVAKPKPAPAQVVQVSKQAAAELSPEQGGNGAEVAEATSQASTGPEESVAIGDQSPFTDMVNSPSAHATAPAAPAAALGAPASAAKSASTSARPAWESSAAPAATEQPPAQLAYAPPTLLLFDGRGEEKGYMKYAANAELLWQPQGTQYSARLEISTFGIRLRTWTSKGTLGENGLQPTRFGDRPRGAEQATHFQRDKGLITFSANNPDVPLQAGAQDKLSALLQLSALVAGAPQRYPAGASIEFQAADAHRAEIWNFKADAAENLELPGGTLLVRRFTKEPTVEFDQRIEVWLAPDLHYLPVRLRITEANGAFADLLWRKTQQPE